MTLLQRWYLFKARIKENRISKLIGKDWKILDIGTGNGALAYLLQNNGHQICTLDIKNQSAFPEIAPEIYDGKNLPYSDGEFDLVTIITVLHHTRNPEQLVSHAACKADRLIIMEDIYTNPIQKYTTWFFDSLNNLEFWDHPHSNKTDEGWRQLFAQLGLRVTNVYYYPFLGIFKQVTYVLEKE